MNKRKKFTLHLGVHRTGSTSIQQAMANSRGILRSHGFLYPTLYNLNDHVKIPWLLKSGKISTQDFINEIEKKDEEIIRDIIISAEDFCILKDFNIIRDLNDRFDVNLIIYLKDQITWLESWYNQHVKWPWMSKFSGCDPEFFLKNIGDFYWIDYENLLNRISRNLPFERMHVAVVDKEFGVTDTVEHFFGQIGVDTRWLNSYRDVNASLTAAKLDILRRININELSPAGRSRVLMCLKKLEVDEDNGSKQVFSDSECAVIQKKFRRSNSTVAEKYFGRQLLFKSPGKRAKEPVRVSDDKAYKLYIPELLKSVSDR